jgi:hypothetical protein
VWRGIAAGVTALTLSACIGLGAGSAASATATTRSGLSKVVLAHSLPGFTLLPGGQYDGPIPKSTLDQYPGGAQWQQDVATGKLSGFVRAWSHQYQRGLAFIYISALRMPNAAYAPLFTSTITATAQKQPNPTAMAVSSIKGATAYRTSPPQQIGRSTGYWVIFTRGTTGVFVYAVGPPRTLTAALVVGLARQQAARLSGS